MTTSTSTSTATSASTSTRPRPRATLRANLRFAGHYLEMVVAMLVGMMALGPLWSLAAPGLTAQPAAAALIMAANMTAGMALWMWIRRHSWPRIAEMSAAMSLPFIALLVPYGLGAISAGTLMIGGHIVMFPAMLAAMLWRRAEYSHAHHRHK